MHTTWEQSCTFSDFRAKLFQFNIYTQFEPSFDLRTILIKCGSVLCFLDCRGKWTMTVFGSAQIVSSDWTIFRRRSGFCKGFMIDIWSNRKCEGLSVSDQGPRVCFCDTELRFTWIRGPVWRAYNDWFLEACVLFGFCVATAICKGFFQIQGKFSDLLHSLQLVVLWKVSSQKNVTQKCSIIHKTSVQLDLFRARRLKKIFQFQIFPFLSIESLQSKWSCEQIAWVSILFENTIIF